LVAELEAIGTDPEKFGAFLSRVALKKERERHCHPTARAPQKQHHELSSPEAARFFIRKASGERPYTRVPASLIVNANHSAM
jgi:hypothetical protein